MAVAAMAIARLGERMEGNGRSGPSRDEAAFMEALRDLDQALDENLDRAERMKARIAELREAHAAGRSIIDLVPKERTPIIVQLLTESADTLHAYGSQVRRAEARALHGEGMTMDQIARLFGVSRQRVSAILRDDSD